MGLGMRLCNDMTARLQETNDKPVVDQKASNAWSGDSDLSVTKGNMSSSSPSSSSRGGRGMPRSST